MEGEEWRVKVDWQLELGALMSPSGGGGGGGSVGGGSTGGGGGIRVVRASSCWRLARPSDAPGCQAGRLSSSASNVMKERLSRFHPSEQDIHLQLRGKVVLSGYMWERRYFVCTESGLFVQDHAGSAEMTPCIFDHAKVEPLVAVPGW